MLSHKKTSMIPVATVLSALLNLSLNIILVPHFGYFAAAVNTAVSYALLAGITYFFAAKLSDFSFEYARWAKASLVAGGIYTLAMIVNITPSFLSVSINVGLLILFPIFLYFFSFWSNDELQNIYKWLRQRNNEKHRE